MHDRNATSILQRLLTVTSACRDAFGEAAYAVNSPRLSALFVRRAQHQDRIAAYLTEHLDSGHVPSATLPRTSTGGATRALRAGTLPSQRDPHALLSACIRVLDTAILEFARAYAPTMPLAQRISLERHHDQMRWSRDELISLRRTYKWSQASVERGEVDVQPTARTHVWFGSTHDAVSPNDWVSQLVPLDGEMVHHHHSGRIS